MVSTVELTTELDRWEETASEVLSLARRATDSPAVDAPDEDLPETGDPADLLAERLIADSEAVISRLESAIETDREAHAQVSALVMADLVAAHSLLATADDFVQDALEPTFEDNFALLASQVRTPVAPVGPAADAAVPTEVREEFEQIETAAGNETYELLKNGAIQYSAVALDQGLKALLAGRAAEQFEEIRNKLRKVRDALKRAANKIVAWITKRVISLLPKDLRDKLSSKIDDLRDKVEEGAGSLIGSGMGIVLGRTDAQRRWTEAADAGKDLTAALAAVPEATAAHLQRIGWITSGRKAIDKFGVTVVIGLVSRIPAAQVAYFCAAGAVFLFVAWQLWDGIFDIGSLAPG
jgi:hypothetical protein